MSKEFIVVKEIGFCYGHRVPRHEGKCFNLHGHEAKVQISVAGPLVKEGAQTGMVMDFGHIKTALETRVKALLDHRMLLYDQDPVLRTLIPTWPVIEHRPGGPSYKNDVFEHDGFWLRLYQDPTFGHLLIMNIVPTAENLASLVASIMIKALSEVMPMARVCRVDFWETPTSRAIYHVPVGTI